MNLFETVKTLCHREAGPPNAYGYKINPERYDLLPLPR